MDEGQDGFIPEGNSGSIIMSIDELDWAIEYAQSRMQPIRKIRVNPVTIFEFCMSKMPPGAYYGHLGLPMREPQSVRYYRDVEIINDGSMPRGKWEEVD